MEHCDHPDQGCPVAALAPDISRAKLSLKKRIISMLKEHRDEIMTFVPGL